jgi:alpha-beta hydrolase superfamily lysophospholipase
LVRSLLAMGLAAVVIACAPSRQAALVPPVPAAPALEGDWFTSFDGARLGLRVWTAEAQDASPPLVIIAVHGMSVDSSAFNAAGDWWSRQGATVYAYDQRGFGRSPNWMIWPEPDVMRGDLRTAVATASRRHPGARVVVVAESMGAAMSVTAATQDAPLGADALVLVGPGYRGWGALPWSYRISLWTSAHLRPGWIVRPPRFVTIVPTDNRDKLIENGRNPNIQKTTRIDAVHGVVSLMEEADAATRRLPADLPTLLLYGANDQVIPESGVRRATRSLPAHVRTAYYAKGWHMLVNDLQAEAVWRDILAFARDPLAPLPSGAPALPWRPVNESQREGVGTQGR